MKKYLYLLMVLCLSCLFFVRCSDKNTTPTAYNKPKTRKILMSNTEGVDVDLTLLSSTMVYAEVYNIMTNPEAYVGKTIKMSGPYYTANSDRSDLRYHYVIIEDATACCKQGLEFIWNGKHTYPDDYPKEQTKIEVVGVFGSYAEISGTSYYLAVDDISIRQ